MSRPAQLTADELFRLNLPNKRTELVDGRLYVREPAAARHGEAAARLLSAIVVYVYAHKLGRVFTAETGFTLRTNPDTVRAPDVAFVRADRATDLPARGYPAVAPDLVVEVLSPDDRPREVRAKVENWLRAGSTLVWVVDPVKRTAHVYRADGTETPIAENGVLDGEAVLPGFACALESVL